MAALSCQFHSINHLNSQKVKSRSKHSIIYCSAQPIQSNIKVVINGAAKEIGRAAVDTHHVGEDIGQVCGMEEPLEIPILNDLIMVLGSISQSKATTVVVDFTDPSTVYDNVKQATTFGMKSVVYVPDTVAALSAFCEKASMVSKWVAIELSKTVVEGVQIEHVDISNLPLLNTDLEKEGTFPAEVEVFRHKILGVDSILLASPKYNYFVSAPLKNALDWASRPPNVWAGKPAAIVSVGGGHGGAKSHYHLCQIGVFIDLHFINKPEFLLNAFQPPAKFNSDGDLIDEDV